MTHNKATFGIFRSKQEVNSAVSLLTGLGFGNARASVLFPDHEGAQDFPQVQKSELAKFARIGSFIGAGLFVIFSIVMVSGAFPLGNLGVISTMGKISAVVVAALLGGVIGAVCGGLVGIGTPDRAGHRYGQYIHSGGILLSVHSDNPAQQKKLEEIFERSGAQDITSVDEAQGWKDVLDEKSNLERVNLSRLDAFHLGQSARRADPTYGSNVDLSKEQQVHV